jgi:hypothetical protein
MKQSYQIKIRRPVECCSSLRSNYFGGAVPNPARVHSVVITVQMSQNWRLNVSNVLLKIKSGSSGWPGYIS